VTRGRGAFCDPLNEPSREFEFGTKTPLEFLHLAAVGFVVMPGQVQHAMKDKDFDLRKQIVAEGGGLGASRLQRDGDVATRQRLAAGKGKHVGGFVLAAKLQVEALNFGVAREQNIYLAGESSDALSPVGKTCEGQTAQVFRFSSF
jgi:hypothetical protein